MATLRTLRWESIDVCVKSHLFNTSLYGYQDYKVPPTSYPAKIIKFNGCILIHFKIHLVKWLNWSGGCALGRPREGPWFESRVCDCFQPRFLTRFFSPNFHVIHVFRELSFSHLRKGIQADAQRIRSSWNYWKKRVNNFLSSTWTREDVEPHQRLPVESPRTGS